MKALDRLAEALARFKTGHENGRRKNERSKRKTKGNLDAKHVAGVVMIENADSVTIVSAKNEGLDEVDKVFLSRVFRTLETISRRGTIEDDDIGTLFDEIFQHNENRVGYYSNIVRYEFGQVSGNSSSNNIRNGFPTLEKQPAAQNEWQGLDFKQKQDNHTHGSGTVDDCLSNAEDEGSIDEVFSQLESLFGGYEEDDKNSAGIKPFLKGFHDIIKHPKKRPAVKNRIRQRLHHNERSFSKAWSALLFLGRTFHAAVVLAEVASKVNAFAKIRFIHPAGYSNATEKTRRTSKSPMDVLKKLQIVPSHSAWSEYLQSPEAIDAYRTLLRVRPTIHAETQLIYLLEEMVTDNAADMGGHVLPYVGCSKKCWFFCHLLCRQHGEFLTHGAHETVLPQWDLPLMPPKSASGVPDTLLHTLGEFRDALASLVGAVTKGRCPPRLVNLIRQSTAALSTAAVVERGKPCFNKRPSIHMSMAAMPGFVGAADRQVQFVPSLERPGYAIFMAP